MIKNGRVNEAQVVEVTLVYSYKVPKLQVKYLRLSSITMQPISSHIDKSHAAPSFQQRSVRSEESKKTLSPSSLWVEKVGRAGGGWVWWSREPLQKSKKKIPNPEVSILSYAHYGYIKENQKNMGFITKPNHL